MLEKAAFYSLYKILDIMISEVLEVFMMKNTHKSPAESPEILAPRNQQDWKKSDRREKHRFNHFGILGSSPPESEEGSLQ